MKKTPTRSCMMCREKDDKRQLLRIVRTKDGEVFFDKTSRANGRGAYVCDKEECVDKIISTNKLAAAFKTNIEKETLQKVYDDVKQSVNKD